MTTVEELAKKYMSNAQDEKKDQPKLDDEIIFTVDKREVKKNEYLKQINKRVAELAHDDALARMAEAFGPTWIETYKQMSQKEDEQTTGLHMGAAFLHALASLEDAKIITINLK